MSLRAVVEVALHFESFRNVDLFHQGLYHLRTRLYRDDGELRLMAVPYAYCTYPVVSEKRETNRTDHSHILPAQVNEDEYTFSTRSFLVRYCEEEVELNDIGQFRIEVGLDEVELSRPFMLEVDLMFADLTQNGGADSFGENPDVDATEFKSVSTQQFRIHGFGQGVHEYVPVVFDEFHFCLANLVAHTILIDVRFRSHPLLPINRPESTNELRNATPEVKPISTQNGALSLADCIYGKHTLNDYDSLLQITESFYQKHFGLLSGSYLKLMELSQHIAAKCLTNAQRQAFADDLATPDQGPFDAIPVHPKELKGGRVIVANINPILANGNGPSMRAYLTARIMPTASAQVFATQLYRDFNAAFSQILKLWHKLLNVMTYSCHEVASLFRISWEHEVGKSWRNCIIKKDTRESVTASDEANLAELHQQQADRLRSTAKANAFENACIEDMSMRPDMQDHPILFEQRYKPKSSSSSPPPVASEPEDIIPSMPKTYRGVHLFVLVHGWQGNAFDMRLMKNNLALLLPDAIFLCSTANEDLTDCDLNESGMRLAQEVQNYINDWCPGSALGRLSFITFSLGGLIVRSALPLLQEYSSKMFTIMTICSAHLGYVQSTPGVLTYGLKALTQWRNSPVLMQLTLQDGTNTQQLDSTVYRLSQARGFEFFRWVVVVGSAQDQFAPLPTARACTSKEWENQSDKKIYFSLVQNLWAPVDAERVFRFDVNFNISEKNLDSAIGRSAHIRFLENQPIMKMILHNYAFFFR